MYQKVVAEIQLASPGSPGVNQVQPAYICILGHSIWHFSLLTAVRPCRHSAVPQKNNTMCQMEIPVQAGSSSLKGIPSQGCTPLRPSYVTDLRGHTLKGNTTLAPADNNTARKVTLSSGAASLSRAISYCQAKSSAQN